MSDLIGNGDMRWLHGAADDAAFESAIRGSDSDPALALLVDRVRSGSEKPLPGATKASHVAMAVLAARQAAVDAGDAAEPAVQSSSRRRKLAYAGFTSGLAVKLLFGAVAVAAVTGGTAAVTGNLPGGLQDAVSGAASHLGVDLPSGHQTATDHNVATTSETTTTLDVTSTTIAGTEDEDPNGHERAEAYTAAVAAWTECVQSRDATGKGNPTPHEACGDHPDPHDFGLPGEPPAASGGSGKDNAPGQQDDKGKSDDSQGNSDDAPGRSGGSNGNGGGNGNGGANGNGNGNGG
jgi:uncharacterized membrane protein YgcG